MHVEYGGEARGYSTPIRRIGARTPYFMLKTKGGVDADEASCARQVGRDMEVW
jgi:hypothetical protein